MLLKSLKIVRLLLNLEYRYKNKKRLVMKKVLILAALVFAFLSVSAQDNEKKDILTEDGDRIKATLFHDSGEVSQTGFFTKEGELTGDWTSYDRKGIKTAAAQYDNGRKVGTWFFWKGDTLTEVTYTDSKITSVNNWKSNENQVVSNK